MLIDSGLRSRSTAGSDAVKLADAGTHELAGTLPAAPGMLAGMVVDCEWDLEADRLEERGIGHRYTADCEVGTAKDMLHGTIPGNVVVCPSVDPNGTAPGTIISMDESFNPGIDTDTVWGM
jgi:hypothetical protein